VVPALAGGRLIGANAITEAEAGSDVFALTTRAVREGDHYRLNGVKSFVTNGPVADVFLVYAKTAPEHGELGISAFLVERDTNGLTVGDPFDKMGLKTSPVSQIYLADCLVPVGNLFALVQKDIKRMLAYSGVAHMGYLLIALVNLGRDAYGPVLVYLLAYALMNAGAFAVVALLYARPGEQHLVSELSGWGYSFPLLGICLTVCMLSLGGIPPTAGFLGKYLIFLHAVQHGDVWLAVIGVATSLIGVFYYLRVVYTLYMRPEERAPEGLLVDGWGRTAAVLAALGTLAVGIFPGRLLTWVWEAMQSVY
jgi:hypothetical protein